MVIFTHCLPPMQMPPGNMGGRGDDIPIDQTPTNSSRAYVIWVDTPWKQFLMKRDEFRRRGYRLQDIETYVVKGNRLYAGLWHARSDEHRLWQAESWRKFHAKWQEYRNTGFRIIDVEIFEERGVTKFLGIFRQESSQNRFLVDLYWDELLRTRDEYDRKGYRLIDIEPYTDNNKQLKYAAIWDAGSDQHRLWSTSQKSEFLRQWNTFNIQGLRLIDLEIFLKEGRKQYTGVWRGGNGPYHLWTEAPWEGFKSKRARFDREGQQLIDLEVEAKDGKLYYSGVWIGGQAKFAMLQENQPAEVTIGPSAK